MLLNTAIPTMVMMMMCTTVPLATTSTYMYVHEQCLSDPHYSLPPPSVKRTRTKEDSGTREVYTLPEHFHVDPHDDKVLECER